MKTIIPKLIVLGLFAVASVTSCKKDDVSPSVNTILLTQQPWKFEIYGLDENNDGTIDQSENSMFPCESDDAFTFYNNGTGIYTSGTVKCTQDDPPVLSLNWNFSNNETELQIFNAPEKIRQLDNNTLEIYYEELNSQGQPVKYIRRFQH